MKIKNNLFLELEMRNCLTNQINLSSLIGSLSFNVKGTRQNHRGVILESN
jgi:hypothetical protein